MLHLNSIYKAWNGNMCDSQLQFWWGNSWFNLTIDLICEVGSAQNKATCLTWQLQRHQTLIFDIRLQLRMWYFYFPIYIIAQMGSYSRWCKYNTNVSMTYKGGGNPPLSRGALGQLGKVNTLGKYIYITPYWPYPTCNFYIPHAMYHPCSLVYVY